MKNPRAVAVRGEICLSFLALLALWAAAGCNEATKPASAKAGPKAAVPVKVAEVVEKTVPIQIKTFGNVQAYASVAIRAQVNVELMTIGFKEGEEVKEGRVLFTLDARPYEAAVRQAEAAVRQAEAAFKQAEATRKQAEAMVVKDKALAKNAKTEADRAQTLVKQGAYTQEQYDNAQANQGAMDAAVDADVAAVAAGAAAMDAAQANVDAGNAAVENAKVQLSFCTIRSPMDGRAGSRTVDVGNIIKAVDMQPMVVINQVHPIYVGFSIPEQQLPLVKKYLNDREKMKVEAIIPGDPGLPATGELTFIDNAIDAATGTILLKGTFPNDDRRLWPGQYVDVVLTLSQQPNARVIPSVAVQTGQQGQYVFVLKPGAVPGAPVSDQTVEARPVTTGRPVDDSIVIEKGLQPQEQVVTDGQFRLVDGARVEVVQPGAETAPEPGAGAAGATTGSAEAKTAE
jgi:multidrug efflux system membrane fusion protein